MLKLTILFTCFSIVFNSNGQLLNEDSLHLSKHLEPFRKHLDSVTSGITAKHLLNIYKSNFSKNVQIHPKKELTQDGENNANGGKGFKSKKNWGTKYSYEEIIPNDTNHILFIETEYDLPNRIELENLKTKYSESKTLKDRINVCINYISELSMFYPSRSDWKFSRSLTLNRYINHTAYLIERLPKDTTKSFMLGKFGYCLQQIDRIELQSYILQLYLKAEQILIGPYKIYLKENDLSDDSAYFRRYINQGSLGNALININYFISDLLEPEEKFDLKNELYPFLKKRLFYLQRALKTFEIQNGKNHMSNDYTIAEEKYLMALTSFMAFDKSKYYSNILYDRILLLKDYISKIVFPRDDSLTKKREYNLYYSLGYIFIGQKEYNYALKAFYKAAEIRLNFSSVPMTIRDVPIYVDIFETIQKDKSNRSSEQEEAMADAVNLYLSIINSEHAENKYDTSIFDFFKLLGQSSLMIYNDQLEKAEILLRSKKRELFHDTLYINSNPEIVGFLYRLLLNTNWAPNKVGIISDVEREADSIMYLIKKHGSLDVETSYNGDEYVAEKLSNLEGIESYSKWYAEAEDLKEEIRKKTMEIASLKIVRDNLNTRISKLSLSVESLTKEINGLNKSLTYKKKEAGVLNDSIRKKNITLSTISKQNILLEANRKSATLKIDSLNKLASTFQGRIENLNSIKGTLIGIISFLALILFSILIIIRKKTSRIKALNKDIVSKEKEAEEKDLGKKLTEQKLLNDIALSHDLLTQIEHIPEFIRGLQSNLSTYPSDLEESIKYAEDVNYYFESNFGLRGQLLNKLGEEIQMAKTYSRIWEKIQGKKNFVKINSKSIPEDLLESVEVPKHNIVSFISNAFRHGALGKEEIIINIKCERKDGGVSLFIEDNGVGVSNLHLDPKRENRGLGLVMKQIDNYNSVTSHPYKIDFNLHNIQNIIENGKIKGARVIYKMLKK